MKVVEETEVKHVKDIIQLLQNWNEGDRFHGDGEWERTSRLLHIYESNDKIYKVTSSGTVISSEFKEK